MRDVFDDLAAEEQELEKVLSGLSEEDAQTASSCPGWTIADVVLHLAQTQEMVVTSIKGGDGPSFDGGGASTVDELMDRWVESERGAAFGELRERWSRACAAALDALRNADPAETFTWAAAPLKARTLATTRLSEQWIHAHDITDPLGIDYPDSDRIWHIARLAHRTIPYAFVRAGAPPPPDVYAILTSPSGTTWTFGDEGAPTTVRGGAGEFVRIAARRMPPADASSITAEGERADEVLDLIRTYA